MRPALKNTLRVWVGITFFVIASLVLIYLRNGISSLNLFIRNGHYLILLTLASTSITWLLAGTLLYLLVNEKVNKAISGSRLDSSL